ELLKLAEVEDRTHLGVTCDGPRGPRRALKPGAIYLASRPGMTILPTGIAFRRPWRANSWDRFALPTPFSRAVVVGGRPLVVPPDLDRDGIERFRAEVERILNELQDAAQAYVD